MEASVPCGSGLHLGEGAIGDGFTQRRGVKSVCPLPLSPDKWTRPFL